jgi:excisionase family DNA binding protein
MRVRMSDVTAPSNKRGPESLLDIPALAARLAVSERFVRRLVHERRIPYLKLGHFVRFDPRDVGQSGSSALLTLRPEEPP